MQAQKLASFFNDNKYNFNLTKQFSKLKSVKWADSKQPVWMTQKTFGSWNFWGSMPQIPLEACFFGTFLENRSVFTLDLWLSWHSNAAKLIIQHCCVTNNIINYCIKNIAHIPRPFRKMHTSYNCFLTQQAPVQMLDSAISTE